ncbi:MAG: alpha-1,6-mannosyltransferase [Bogoriella megaspora]|nr:MAG: alpha-1,6-mannosyltransferase [Bogoriella megaspora]
MDDFTIAPSDFLGQSYGLSELDATALFCLHEDIEFEIPAPKRRRLDCNYSEPRSSCKVEQSSQSPWLATGKERGDGESYDNNVIPDSCEDNEQAFLEHVWGARDLRVDYEIFKENVDSPDRLDCFGMLEGLPIQVRQTETLESRRGITPAKVVHNRVLLENDGSNIGTIEPEIAKAIRVLCEYPDIELQLQCTIKTAALRPLRKRSPRANSNYHAELSVIIYGALRRFDDLGDYLEKCGLYLQDPDGCKYNVAYRNPHRLSGMDEKSPMTIEQAALNDQTEQEAHSVANDFLNLLVPQQFLAEAEMPWPVKTVLLPHQCKALTFMQEREKGWDLNGIRPDIWKDAGRGCYLNTVSKETQVGRPPSFQGGILADYMGLGKSLSMISLIASDSTLHQNQPLSASLVPQNSAPGHLHCTLVVVPSNLLHTWNTQLNRHLKPNTTRCRTHHAKDRIKHRSELDSLDILITTYQTIVTEFRKRRSSSVFFNVNWHRIVLDEAHYIRDRSTSTFKAVCSLEGCRRWVMTGTSLQNSISDLAALFQFIRAYPYSDSRSFDRDISSKIGTEEQSIGYERLKKLLSCVAIRRSDSAISLPGRLDVVEPVLFSDSERRLYDAIHAQAILVLEEARNANDVSHRTYRNALRYIMALRMVCNLGNAATLAISHDIPVSETNGNRLWGALAATEAYEDLLAAGQACCQHCKTPINLVEDPDSTDFSGSSLVAQCLRILCGKCSQNAKNSRQQKPWCGHRSNHASAFIDPNLRLKADLESLSKPHEAIIETSSKISSLVKAIRATEHEKSVVFSTWTTTLDAIERVLRQAGVNFVRYDGAVSPNRRIAALDKFRNDSTVSVMLITTACGAVGLDLTAASRAYLMEPHWNPFVEEQALSRIHRMGQTKEVTTVRFVVKDSYEQHVIKVQTAKTRTAEHLFPKNDAGCTPDLIQDLRMVLQVDESS